MANSLSWIARFETCKNSLRSHFAWAFRFAAGRNESWATRLPRSDRRNANATGAGRGNLPRRLPRRLGVPYTTDPGGPVEFSGRRTARIRLRRRGDGAGIAGYPDAVAVTSREKLP